MFTPAKSELTHKISSPLMRSKIINPFLDSSPDSIGSTRYQMISGNEEIPMSLISKHDSNFKSALIQIRGMTCTNCVLAIEKHLNAQAGIISTKVALALEQSTVEYDPALTSEKQIANIIEELGYEATPISISKKGTLDLFIYGMTCASCSGKIERSVGKLRGICSVHVNLLAESAEIIFIHEEIGIRDIIETIESLGFNATISDSSRETQLASLNRTKEIKEWRSAFQKSLAFSIPVSIISMILPAYIPEICYFQLGLPGLRLCDVSQLILTVPVQFGIGWRFYKSAWKSLKHNSYTMDVLVCLGTTMSFLFSTLSIFYSIWRSGNPPPNVFFETSATLITFVTLGRYLENMAKSQTSSALSKLMSLAPSYSMLLEKKIENGIEIVIARKIPTEYIRVGDLLKVGPGERIPVDGKIIFGETQIDESILTGEPLLLSKSISDQVISGSINGLGLLHIEAQRVGTDTTLAQIVNLVQKSQTSKSKAPIQKIADRVASVFIQSVIALSLLTFVFWMFYIHFHAGKIPPPFPADSDWLFVCLSMTISVIVVACPCALGLATPTAVMVFFI